LYCKHILLCDILQKRANTKPSFLQRNLCYKIHAKQKKRIEITISLSGSSNPEVQAQNIFPLYALFAKPISAVSHDGHSPVYQFSRACLLTCFDEPGCNNHAEATFIFRDLKTLANIILVSCGILCILFLWNYLCAVFLWFHQFFFLSFVKDKLDKHLMKITSPRAIWRTILLKSLEGIVSGVRYRMVYFLHHWRIAWI